MYEHKSNCLHQGPGTIGEMPTVRVFLKGILLNTGCVNESFGKLREATSTNVSGDLTRHLSSTSFEIRATRPLVRYRKTNYSKTRKRKRNKSEFLVNKHCIQLKSRSFPHYYYYFFIRTNIKVMERISFLPYLIENQNIPHGKI